MDEPRYKHYQGGRFLGRFDKYDLYDKLVENKQGTRLLYAQYGEDHNFTNTPDYVIRSWAHSYVTEHAPALREALRRSDLDKTIGQPFFQDMCDRHMTLGHTFLGPYEAHDAKFDLYFQPGDAPTVHARWGEGGNYASATVEQAKRNAPNGTISASGDAIDEAVRRTEIRGLLPREEGGLRALTHVYVLTNEREHQYNGDHAETEVKGVFTTMTALRTHMRKLAASLGRELHEVPMDPPFICRYEDDPGDEDYYKVEKMELK